MIRYTTGDMFAAGADALVIPVNCVGVMGAGVARVARDRYPEACAEYRRACARRALRPGDVIHVVGGCSPDVLLVATKDHWRAPSRLEWVEEGLRALAAYLDGAGFLGEAAVPALGCGNGGLAWADMRPLIWKHLGPIATECLVYAPGGTEVP